MLYVFLAIVSLMIGLVGSARAESFTSGRCTAGYSAKAAVAGKIITAKDDQTPLIRGARIEPGDMIITLPTGRVALYLTTAPTGPAAAEATIYLEGGSEITLGAEKGPERLIHIAKGTAVVSYNARKGAMILATTSAWVRLARGSIRVEIDKAGAASFSLAQGKADRFEGPVPEKGLATMPGGKPLLAKGQHPASKKLTYELSMQRILLASGRWIEKAEIGDLVPRVTPEMPTPSLPGLGIPSVSAVTQPPQVTSVTSPVVSTGQPLTPTLSQAESLLASKSPASVVVGARLGRTRIVGNPGTAGGQTGVRFNPEARAPFRLSQ